MTRDQRCAIERLGRGAGIRPAAFGDDVFAYYEAEDATIRYQVGPDGDVVARRRFERGRSGAARAGVLALERA